jgi:D-lyxose ketol-isomerase
MKRSQINQIINDSKKFMEEMKFSLPRWAYWGPGDWKGKGESCSEILDFNLGWDITDFGSGDFHNIGLVLFTIRNGHPQKPSKPYCEKLLLVEEEQVTPLHYHWSKTEDIINRGGGNLVFEVYKYSENDAVINEPFKVKVDSIPKLCQPGEKVVLAPGESITFEPYLTHCFYGEKGKGKVLVGEVSTVNEDHSDNRFVDGSGRFPDIIEDEPPVHLLVNDYKNYI